MTFEVFETQYCNECGVALTSFGIRCGDICIADFSFNRSAVTKLTEMCNEQELDICHLFEIVQDFVEKEADYSASFLFLNQLQLS